MQEKTTKKLVVGILAHVDAGKTTLSEALLYLTGETRRLGRVDHRDTYLDTHTIERERGITVFSKQAEFRTDKMQVTLLDTPGHVDFSAEMERTLSVLDYAILVISAVDGVQAHTETLWRLLRRYGVPTFLFVTKMDLAVRSRESLVQELKARLDSGCVDFAGDAREEELAVLDEALFEKYFESGSVERNDITALIRERKAFPCFFGSGLKLTGVEEFLHALESYTEMPTYGAAFGAKVFKIARDQQGARLTYMKLTGGKLRVRTALKYRPLRGDELEEKVPQLRRYSGAKFETADEAASGDVVAVPGLTATYPGQAFGAETAAELPLLEPVMTYRLRLPEGADVRAELPKLQQLQEEDPQLHIVWDERLREIQLRLMGEVQIEVLRRLIRDRFDLNVTIDTGRIRYLETIAGPVEGVGHYEPLRHYAEVHLLLEPLPAGSGLVFASACREDVLDLNWQRLILTHLEEKLHLGVLTGSPITDMAVTITAGRAHLKHTEGGDFREATYRAVRQGLMKAESVLLEPYYDFRLEVPMSDIGRAISDIKLRFGSFEGPDEAGEGFLAIYGRAPVASMRDYAQEVAAYTRGRGRLNCVLGGYDVCHNPDEVRSAIAYDAEADLENTPDSVFCAHGAGHTVKWNKVEEYMHLESGVRFESGVPVESQAPQIRTNNLSVDDKELEKIMEREFGPINRRQYRSAREIMAEEKHAESYRIKKSYLIVDGYNLIYAWDELETLAREDLSAARHRLIRKLENYRAYTKCELILVFDGYLVKGSLGSTEEHNGVHVVYTKEGETGDLYIEKLTNKIGKNESVRVATSDSLIQLAAIRDGVQRISSRELITEIEDVEKQIREDMKTLNGKK